MLDNAVSEEQVRFLLPGAAPCAVLITGRARLTGIEGIRRIDLDVFPPTEAVQFLARLADDERVVRQLTAAADLVELCGYLPLAVRIAGARLAARPTLQLEHLVGLLGDEQRRLDWLVTGDLAVRASLAFSYRALTPESRRLFRLLGLFEVPDFVATLAAAILECPLERAIEHIETLVDAQLLSVEAVDVAGQTRYRFHDLTRLFAAECAELEEEPAERAQAVQWGWAAGWHWHDGWPDGSQALLCGHQRPRNAHGARLGRRLHRERLRRGLVRRRVRRAPGGSPPSVPARP
ncbi:hypothetical protein NKG94_00335 [Micromonospora sp. M12]